MGAVQGPYSVPKAAKNGPVLRTRFRAQNRDHACPFLFVLLKGTETRSQFWDRNMVPKLGPFVATGGTKKDPGVGPLLKPKFKKYLCAWEGWSLAAGVRLPPGEHFFAPHMSHCQLKAKVGPNEWARKGGSRIQRERQCMANTSRKPGAAGPVPAALPANLQP